MKTHRHNGDESVDTGTLVAASRATSPGEAQRASGPAAAAKQHAPAEPQHAPAFTPPQASPAVPRDEFHGKGGAYVLIDGKRVPADQNGNPRK